ncbi:MAG: signal peptidase I [Acidimicrobiales bacterium]|nr:signal peptidase I [Acidimicrobiales bacterium]
MIPSTAHDGTRPRPTRSVGAEVRFYAGLVALIGLLTGVVLAVAALVPAVVLGWSPTVITSTSMEPALRVGDVVLVDPARADRLRPGQVITFRAPESGALRTHRVVEVRGQEVITKGDANGTQDQVPVALVDVVGRAVAVVPFAGAPMTLASERRWSALALVAAAAALCAWLARYALLPEHHPWEVRARREARALALGVVPPR